jgi:hypothetical protein
MDNITKRYLKDVEIGENEKQMKKWNDYVKEHLGIDNVTMYRKAEENTKKSTEENTKENIKEKMRESLKKNLEETTGKNSDKIF